MLQRASGVTSTTPQAPNPLRLLHQHVAAALFQMHVSVERELKEWHLQHAACAQVLPQELQRLR
jgi:hypothetical protein